jgi:serine/threonine protein kinase
MIGTTLGGRYTIVRQLGQGGMGAVYEARHTGTGRRVAVKVITADIGKNPGLIARFEVEGRAAGRLESQYVAHVLDVGRDDATSTPFMVMEYLAGEDVQQMIKRLGPVRPELALRIAAQACLGLEKAHAAGIVHRDIKSANLFMTERDGGERLVKILDFGIAKVKMDELQNTEGGLTKTGSLIGSPMYMSPEQARGSRSIDHRSDLWSLGIVLYQLLSGSTPFGHIEALGELIIVMCSEPARSVQLAAPWVAGDVARIVARALQIAPAARYQSAGEMLRDLKALIHGGLSIDEAMVVSLPEEERARVAPPEASAPGSQSVHARTGAPISATTTGSGSGAVADGGRAGAVRWWWAAVAGGAGALATLSLIVSSIVSSSAPPEVPAQVALTSEPAVALPAPSITIVPSAPAPSITVAPSATAPSIAEAVSAAPLDAGASKAKPSAGLKSGPAKPVPTGALPATSKPAAGESPAPATTVSGRIIRTDLP